MVQIKHFTELQEIPNFWSSRGAKWPWRDKILSADKKIIGNQSELILVIASIRPFTSRVSGKIIFHAKLSERFLLRQPLRCIGVALWKRATLSLLFWNDGYVNFIYLNNWMKKINAKKIIPVKYVTISSCKRKAWKNSGLPVFESWPLRYTLINN